MEGRLEGTKDLEIEDLRLKWDTASREITYQKVLLKEEVAMCKGSELLQMWGEHWNHACWEDEHVRD